MRSVGGVPFRNRDDLLTLVLKMRPRWRDVSEHVLSPGALVTAVRLLFRQAWSNHVPCRAYVHLDEAGGSEDSEWGRADSHPGLREPADRRGLDLEFATDIRWASQPQLLSPGPPDRFSHQDVNRVIGSRWGKISG